MWLRSREQLDEGEEPDLEAREVVDFDGSDEEHPNQWVCAMRAPGCAGIDAVAQRSIIHASGLSVCGAALGQLNIADSAVVQGTGICNCRLECQPSCTFQSRHFGSLWTIAQCIIICKHDFSAAASIVNTRRRQLQCFC